MILVNFSHPITTDQLARIESILDTKVSLVIPVACQFDHALPFAEQVMALLEQVELSAEEWQTGQFIINLPAFAPIAAVLLAELHGLMGYFPAIIRLKPVNGAITTQFEIAEIINLQAVRDRARESR